MGNVTWKTPSASERFGAEAALGEDVQHAVVLAQHVGLELGDAVGARDRRQVLEQQRAEAASLVGIADRERHLGTVRRRGRVVGDGVARRRDDALLVVDPLRRHQRRPAHEVLLGELVELLLGEPLSSPGRSGSRPTRG